MTETKTDGKSQPEPSDPLPARKSRWPRCAERAAKETTYRSFIKAMEDGFISRIDKSGKEHKFELPPGITIADLIVMRTLKKAMRGDAQA
jgi:hypothetical protein